MKMDSRGYENLYIPGAARCGNLGERASVLSPVSRGTWLGPEKLHSDGGGDSCEKKKSLNQSSPLALGTVLSLRALISLLAKGWETLALARPTSQCCRKLAKLVVAGEPVNLIKVPLPTGERCWSLCVCARVCPGGPV